MRRILVLVTIVSLMTACSSESDRPLSAIKVEIVETERGYTLVLGGEHYAVKGAGMVVDDIEHSADAPPQVKVQ